MFYDITFIHINFNRVGYSESHGCKSFKVIDPNEHSWKDDLITDFYDNWSIEKTCDTVKLESSHPLKPTNREQSIRIFYTHKCKNDEIAYFKVDVNLIDSLPLTYLGNV